MDLQTATGSSASSSASFSSITRALDLIQSDNTAFTENGAKAFESTNSVLLDFFFKLVRGISQEEEFILFQNAWLEDPLNTIKVLLNCRDCRNGKGEKQIVLMCLLWLRKYKPKTYLKNLQNFLKVGYFQDLLNVVKLAEKDGQPTLGQTDMIELEYFAEQLREDQWHYANKLPISLAAKWAPTEGHADDCEYEFASRLAKIMFPNAATSTSAHLKEYRILLTELRKHLRVVESQMAHNEWAEIEYSAVPAKSHRLHAAAFRRHDPERYQEYLNKVKTGEKKINSTGIQPHEIVVPFIYEDPENAETLECQWRDLIEKLRQKTGGLDSVLPLCDVSGSMEWEDGLALKVCIALGLLITELSTGPFKDMVMTFHANPTLVKIVGDSLGERVRQLRKIPFGLNTDLTAAFEAILNHATMMNCTQEQLPKVLIIFSDMQFDEACPDTTHQATVYEDAKRKFEAAGYKLPSIVFWNLRATKNSFPVTMNEDGVAMLSGYSAELLKEFMENIDSISPMNILYKILDKYGDVEVDESEKGPIQIGKTGKKCVYFHGNKTDKRLRKKARGKGPGSQRRIKGKKVVEDEDLTVESY